MLSRSTSGRIPYIDALRGVALVLMVLNHAAGHLLDRSLDPGRYYLVYLTVSLSAPLFLFLVGFSLSLSFHNNQQQGRLHFYRQCLRRGTGLLAAGYMMNFVIAPGEPFYSGGILQTIGIAILLVGPVVPWLQGRAYYHGALILALMLYLAFVSAYPALSVWIARHPVFAHMFFEGFPPWPWISMVLAGLGYGCKWLEAGNRLHGERQKLSGTAITGMICLVIYFGWTATHGETFNFSIANDYIINRHWLPGSLTVFWIIGMIFSAFAAMPRFFAGSHRYLQWLVPLGQAAFVLYIIHLIIIAGLMERILGVRFHQWWQFAGFNLLLITALVYFSSRYKPVMRHIRETMF